MEPKPKCHFCGAEVTHGYLVSGRPICWECVAHIRRIVGLQDPPPVKEPNWGSYKVWCGHSTRPTCTDNDTKGAIT